MSGVLETITIIAVAEDLNNFPYKNITNIAFNSQDQVDSDLSEDSPSVSVLVNYDNDDDYVIDSSDLDDDNDGILDTVECPISVSNFALTETATLSSTLPVDSDSNTTYDFQEAGAPPPMINKEPTDQRVFMGDDGLLI